jgi:hypothetical protein
MTHSPPARQNRASQEHAGALRAWDLSLGLSIALLIVRNGKH